jgi:hypothetical protein
MIKINKKYKTRHGEVTIEFYEQLGTQYYGKVTHVQVNIFKEAILNSTFWFTKDGKFGRDDYSRSHPLDLRLQTGKHKLPNWF